MIFYLFWFLFHKYIFFIDDIESVSSGWLTSETIVQLKMFNNPITIWKRKHRGKRISVHLSTIDISRKESDVSKFLKMLDKIEEFTHISFHFLIV